MFNTIELTIRLMSNNVYKNTFAEKINTSEPSKEEYDFYKKRILHMIKDMLKGTFPNENIKQLHIEYMNVIIEHIKRQDTTDILQKEHIQKEVDNVKKDLEPFDISISDKAVCRETISKKVTLDNFVTSTTCKDPKKLLSIPSKREINIKTEEHKTKGLKSNSVNLLKNDQSKCV